MEKEEEMITVTAQIMEVKGMTPKNSLDKEYTIRLLTNDPTLMKLSVLEADQLVDVTFTPTD